MGVGQVPGAKARRWGRLMEAKGRPETGGL